MEASRSGERTTRVSSLLFLFVFLLCSGILKYAISVCPSMRVTCEQARGRVSDEGLLSIRYRAHREELCEVIGTEEGILEGRKHGLV